MNLELLDPWEQEYPQIIEETIEDGYVLNCRFNKRGTLLAGGCLDGRCVVWDYDTRGIARNLHGHIKPISSVSWSRNGRFLLSASKDWNCIVWDLIHGTELHRIKFDAPVLCAQFHPRNNYVFVVVLQSEAPVLVDVSDGKVQRYELPTSMKSEEGDGDVKQNTNTVQAICFSHRGDRIYTGTSKGSLSVIDTKTKEMVWSERITGSTIKQLCFDRKGRDLLVNASDRIIRVFSLESQEAFPELTHKFQDLVNRLQWTSACFSADGDFVIAGSAHRAEHNIYIWDKVVGNLVKILEGPKEQLDDLAWHPIRPMIASVSGYGNVYIWSTNHQENWSSFAPDFTELEENLEYEEREDEFDVIPQEEMSKRKLGDEDVYIDVTTIDKMNPFDDSDGEDPDEITYLPTQLDEEDERRVEDEDEHHVSRKRKRVAL
ncbi:hypothetical protein BZG36_03866 [Bifiguratus adelaidae]|uniref:Uncharacterized protein n=1 Tax=Bifiguratus adelaidae TaxID=1938954 RepID=A0A261XXN7_9FUNG|nr:hypothetical protein BZG36_03866 [Bifiguratus adelaidae]